MRTILRTSPPITLMSSCQRRITYFKVSTPMPRGYPPSIFVSSTCYDLSQVRLDLKRFIETLGYDAVISESSAFPINPETSTIENCLNAVRDRADILVLIVGARYGTVLIDRDRSITNLEYLEAKSKGIPVYVFIADKILHTLPIWRDNRNGDYSKVVDSPKLFEFADYLRTESGQWVFGFSEVNDIVEKLRIQLAHLFTDALEIRGRVLGAKLPAELINLPAEPLTILLGRPKAAWEYRFFAAVLRCELEGLSQLRLDVKYNIQIGPVIPLDNPQEVMRWMGTQMTRVMRLIKSAEKLMNEVIQEALGPPGISGDPSLLAYVGRRLACVVEGLMQWQIDFAMVKVPDDFDRIVRITAGIPIEAITKLEDIAPLLDSEIDKAEAARDRGEDYTAKVMMVLGTPIPDEFHTEMQRLQGRYC